MENLQKTYKQVLAETKSTTAKPKQAVNLTAEALQAKQVEILKKAVKISKAKGRTFEILDVFHKGMEYKDEEGNAKIASSDGFRYAGISKAGKSYTGVWRV